MKHYHVVIRMAEKAVISESGSSMITEITFRIQAETPQDALNLAYARYDNLFVRESISGISVF